MGDPSELEGKAVAACTEWAKREGILGKVTGEQYRELAKAFMAGFAAGLKVKFDLQAPPSKQP